MPTPQKSTGLKKTHTERDTPQAELELEFVLAKIAAKLKSERDALQARIDKALAVLGKPLTQEEIEHYADSSSDQAGMETINMTIRILTGEDEA